MTAVFETASDGTGGTLVMDESSTAACYCAGTRILTDRGAVPVEELAIGDGVITVSGVLQNVKWIGRQTF
jgi:hypothetical protein